MWRQHPDSTQDGSLGSYSNITVTGVLLVDTIVTDISITPTEPRREVNYSALAGQNPTCVGRLAKLLSICTDEDLYVILTTDFCGDGSQHA